MAMECIWKRCCSTQRKVFMGHVKPGFVVLVTLTVLLSIYAYFYDLSLMRVTQSVTWFNIVNQTKLYNVLSEGKKNVSFLTERQTIPATTTMEKPTTSITTQYISIHRYVAHPGNYHFILDEPNKCKQNPFLVFMVPVAPHQVDARNAIRSTWGNESSVQGKTVLTLFMVGLTRGSEAQQQLEEESRQHKDLLQSNFVDSYFNLTIKTMVIFDWLATRCPQANYSMKVDSDMYINVENLMSLLLAPNTPRENYITGYLMWNQTVIRDTNSKWYVPEELYPEPRYPTYVLGMGYVFSIDLSPKIVEASEAIKPFNIEDAYVGTCLKRLGVKPSRPPDPSQFRTYMNNPESQILSKLITAIAESPGKVIDFWQKVKGQTDKPADMEQE